MTTWINIGIIGSFLKVSIVKMISGCPHPGHISIGSTFSKKVLAMQGSTFMGILQHCLKPQLHNHIQHSTHLERFSRCRSVQAYLCLKSSHSGKSGLFYHQFSNEQVMYTCMEEMHYVLQTILSQGVFWLMTRLSRFLWLTGLWWWKLGIWGKQLLDL